MNNEGEEKVDATTNGGIGPEPAPAAAGPQVIRKPLTRSRTSRMFTGVCGGIGEYFGVDPILVRLGFAVLAFLGGAGVGLYLAAWILIPLEGDVQSLGEEAMAKASAYVNREAGGDKDLSWLWMALLVVCGLMIISVIGGIGWSDGAWFWATLLIAGGVWLYRQDTYGPRTPQDPAFERPVDPAATAAAAGAAAASATAAAQPGYVARPAPRARPVRVKAPRSPLGRYTFAIGLVVLGTMATFDNAGTIDLSAGQYAAAALITAGAGLLVGSLFGRARSLIFWGLLLVPFVLFANSAGIPFSEGVGERIYSPVEATELAGDSHLFAGHMVFHLDDLEWGSQPMTIDASVFMGQMEIFVPEGVNVRFNGHAEMGSLRFFDIERRGTDVNLLIDEKSGNGPELVLNTDVFMGEVAVHRTDEQAKELS